MADDNEPLDLKLARQTYAEAERMKKAAEQDRAAAEYERGQIEHAKRIMEQTERSLAARERKLKELGDPELVAREKAAEAKLTEAKALLSQYSADRHAAAIALQQINEREQAERSEAV
jgi:hypothetical protein